MNNYLNNSLQNSFNPGHRCNLNLQEHLKYVDTLVLLKIIDTQTGESIKQNMAATFNNNGVSNQTGWNLNQYNAFKDSSLQKPNIEADFDISKSEFLKARECLLNYLQKLDIELNREDLKNIEGNYSDSVKYRTLKVGDSRIRGYGVPHYPR